MSTLMQASTQWSSRPADERFTSLVELRDAVTAFRSNSRERILPSNKLRAVPCDDHKGLQVVGPNGAAVDLTHWSFGQLAARAGAPAGYLRDLPAELAADNVNYGLQRRNIADIGVLLTRSDEVSPVMNADEVRRVVDGGYTPNRFHETSAVAIRDINGATLLEAARNAKQPRVELRAVTGPSYGRVWNADIVTALVDRFGDGITGDFRVPGEFGHEVAVTRSNTTLYASDRDMFVFLADERHRIEVPNRRNGESGSMARGFFVWNSEVGSATFGVSTFLFDYVCCNRIVWGAQGVQEFKIRHTASAPEKWIHEVAPAITAYANSSAAGITQLITQAKVARIDDVETFLAQRFTRSEVAGIKAAHLADESRPIETLWDATTGVTAYARGITYQSDRVDVERKGGKILSLAA